MATEQERQAAADRIEAEALLAEIARHDKATRVADGLQNTRKARDEIRKGGKKK